MRNLVLLLLLANIVFFAWNHWVAEPPSGGAIHFRQSELGPRLELAPEPGTASSGATVEREDIVPPAAVETADTELPADEQAAPAPRQPAPEAAPAAVCLSVGPFGSVEAGEDVLARVRGLGAAAELRTATEEVFLGHWVQIRNIPTRAETNRQMDILQEAGFDDAYPMPEDDGERTISLGLFSDEERAGRLQAQAAELGLNAEVVPQTREATTYWVDVRLEPDQDPDDFAGALGVNNIVTGADATCPR
jgi:hypothetical protein